MDRIALDGTTIDALRQIGTALAKIAAVMERTETRRAAKKPRRSKKKEKASV